jgi:ribonuclease P protein component
MPSYVIHSVKGYGAFPEIFNGGKKFTNKKSLGFFLYGLPGKLKVQSSGLASPEIYSGVSVSKRSAKKAVVRNRVKRLMRQSVRDFFGAYTGELPNVMCFVIIWKFAPRHPKLITLKDVKPFIDDLLENALAGWKNEHNQQDSDTADKGL